MKYGLFGLFFVIILLILVGCNSYANTSILRSDNNRGPWTDTVDESARAYAYKRIAGFSRKGATSLRFEVRDGDCYTAYPLNPTQGWDDCTRDRERSEVREKWTAPWDKTVWYGISIFIPQDYNFFYPKQIIFQWHRGKQPIAFLKLERKNLKFDILTELGRSTSIYDLGNVFKKEYVGKWMDIIWEARWDADDTGYLNMWINGNQVIKHKGATSDKEVGKCKHRGCGTFVKYGIYRSHLSRYGAEIDMMPGDLTIPTQVLFFDEYRRGFSKQEVDVNYREGS